MKKITKRQTNKHQTNPALQGLTLWNPMHICYPLKLCQRQLQTPQMKNTLPIMNMNGFKNNILQSDYY